MRSSLPVALCPLLAPTPTSVHKDPRCLDGWTTSVHRHHCKAVGAIVGPAETTRNRSGPAPSASRLLPAGLRLIWATALVPRARLRLDGRLCVLSLRFSHCPCLAPPHCPLALVLGP